MLKVISLLKRKDETSPEAFADWLLNHHAPLARKIPGLRRYTINVLASGADRTGADAVNEMWYDSDEARLAGMGSPEGKAAGADAAANCASRFHVLTVEHPQF
jgi:uncharacterized protein (TIGR02118 family)